MSQLPGCPPPPPVPNTPPVGDSPVGNGLTRLITDPSDPVKYTANRETDARTAMARGMKEYMEQLSIDFNGRLHGPIKVYQTWAEPEDVAEYPSAVVYFTGPGTYDASNFTPIVKHDRRIEQPDGRYVVTASHLVQEFVVEIWATDPQERTALVAMMEDALVPVIWRFGPLLELPHYHNERATFEKLTMAYDDSETDAMRRYRRAVFTVRGHIPVVRLVELPPAKPRARVEVVDPQC